MGLSSSNFLPFLHDFGTGLPILAQLSGSGQGIINTGQVEIHLVGMWNTEFSKRAWNCTNSGAFLNQNAFTGGWIPPQVYI